MQALQQEIAAAEAKVAELRNKLKQHESRERDEAVSTIKELIRRFGFTSEHLGLNGKKSGSVKKGNRAGRADKGATVAAKYIDPATGAKWTGRGRAPLWLAEHLAAGRAREDYLISKPK
jgi:DNA-binding protein H-NS